MYAIGDVLNEPVTATEAASRLRVSVNAVMQWARRGYLAEDGSKQYLQRVGLSPRNKPMYRFRDVVVAERATRHRAGRTYLSAA